MANKLAGKIAVITGGSSGIGLATAKKFVDEGAYVFVTGRRQSQLDNAKAEIGVNVTAVQGDISRLADLDRLFATVKNEKGSLDILVANAGLVEVATLADATPEHFDRTFNTNARGTFFTVQKGLRLLKDGGSIVLVGSSGYLKGLPAYTTYCATKAAIRSFARCWAAELLPRRIRVNTLSPGAIDTPMNEAGLDTPEELQAAKAHLRRITPMDRIARAEEMASAILFLASDDSSFCTGIDLVADGGILQL